MLSLSQKNKKSSVGIRGAAFLLNCWFLLVHLFVFRKKNHIFTAKMALSPLQMNPLQNTSLKEKPQLLCMKLFRNAGQVSAKHCASLSGCCVVNAQLLATEQICLRYRCGQGHIVLAQQGANAPRECTWTCDLISKQVCATHMSQAEEVCGSSSSSLCPLCSLMRACLCVPASYGHIPQEAERWMCKECRFQTNTGDCK